MSRFFILGSQPQLSIAEIKSLFPSEKTTIAEHMAILEQDQPTWSAQQLQNRLAGITKLGAIIKTLPISEFSADTLCDFIIQNPRGKKILYGLTIYGGSSNHRRELKHLPIQLKESLKSAGFSARWITGDEGTISPAAIHKMNLTTEGYDFCIGISANDIHFGITEAVQNPDEWSLRDFGRPARDAKNGMLPPKLAHIMINIGLGLLSKNELDKKTVLDPFCGGGTVLMEAGVIDQRLNLIGSDIDAKQIIDATKNLDWLVEKRIFSQEQRNSIKLITIPVQSIDQHIPAASVDLIVTEGYLGKPLRGHENQTFLDHQKHEIERLWAEAIPHLAAIQPENSILCMCLPSFKTTHAQATCELKPSFYENFYTPCSPSDQSPLTSHQSTPLSYSRDNQYIKRNLLFFKRK